MSGPTDHGSEIEAHGVPLRAAVPAFPFGPRPWRAYSSALAPRRGHGMPPRCTHPIPAALWDELRAEGLLPTRVPGEFGNGV
ncbi:hypothetical protein ACFQ10_52950 [Streptomyces indonesiensis]